MRKITLVLGMASFLFIVCACKDDETSDMITTTVSGTITDPEGKPMFEAQVWDPITPDKKVKTKKDGTYSLLVSHQGNFKLHVSKKGYRERKLYIKVNARQHKADLQLDYSYIKALSGTVKDPAGNPIAGVVISVSTSDKKFKTDPRGNYSIKVPHSGKFDITLTKTGYKEKTLTVSLETDASAKNVTMDYGYTTAVSGKVMVRKASISVSAEVFASTAPAKKSVTNSDGTYRLTVAHAGNFTVTVSKTGYITRTIKIETTKPQETQNIELEKPSAGKTKVLGYFVPAWDYVGSYPGGKFNRINQIDWSKLSHVMLSIIYPDENGDWYMYYSPEGSWNSLTRQSMAALEPRIIDIIKAKNPNIKILPMVGGNKAMYEDWVEQKNGKTRAKVISGLVTYLERTGYDGIDLDLEGKAITPSWEAFVLELKAALKNSSRNFFFSGALAPWYQANTTNKGAQAFDLVNIMTYDVPATGKASHSSLSLARNGFNYYRRRGVTADKLAIAVATYGYAWNPATQKTSGFGYRSAVIWDRANADRDNFTRGGTTYWHNGRPTARAKVKFAKDNNCHIMVFRLGIDAFDDTEAQGGNQIGKYSILSHIAKSMKEFGMTLAD